MSDPVLTLDRVSRDYVRAGRRLAAVDEVDLVVHRGKTLGIVGESGCGKSTLARLALHLVPPSSGRVLREGQDIARLDAGALRRLRARMQIVFQDPNASLNPRWRVGAIIAEPLRAQGWSRQKRLDRVSEVLDLVGLPQDAVDRLPSAFSGGQKQRIGIARALAPEPDLLICDEAVSALDASIQAQILNLLTDLQARLGLTMVFISHNLAVVRHVSQRVAVMYLGRIVELASEADLFDRPQHPYTRTLIAAVPEPGRPLQAGSVRGEPPDALAPPSGCHFHPRCPLAQNICRRISPPLIEAASGHLASCHFPGASAS
ncbi:peptide/nickel transport system ATP-binding protein [Devosia enhydra]|uniref:Peptide/nickel transport system ATP-binding protein n=1 Tax=Devosia enhydra TaxID=665118 RepID=A0A1K2HXX3_9HYPH|nr:oligopeptide/dipeptide ABC transporter ATP-binding protein [Devosia enhydra]SFZ84557.1 peptide/nickel transport system ATP-binding protein [Devosia enhydra]